MTTPRTITLFTAGLAMLLVAMLPLRALGAEGKEQSVLIINSYHTGFWWVQEHNEAFIETLPYGTSVSVIDLDTKRLPPEAHQGRADAAFTTAINSRPDLVLLTDDNALRMLGQKLIDAGLKVIYLGINGNPRTYLREAFRATGVLERPLLKRAVAYISQILHADTGRGLVLLDNSPTARSLVRESFGTESSSVVMDVPVDILCTNSWVDWQAQVLGGEREGYRFIITGLHHTIVDENGVSVPAEKVLEWTSRYSPVPLFGLWDFNVGEGLAIGGYVLAASGQGYLAGVLALKVLSGTPIEELPPVTDRMGQFIFSRAGLERWGITLPPTISGKAHIID